MLRHRVPTIFTLYMVDVLCCALGCVILLWQVNYHEAQSQTSTAEGRAKEITELKNRLDTSEKTGDSLREHIDELIGKLAANDKTIASLRKDLAASRKNEALAHLSINSLTGDVNSIRKALEASKRQEGLLSLQISDLRKERDKALEVALITKQDYESAQKALAL